MLTGGALRVTLPVRAFQEWLVLQHGVNLNQKGRFTSMQSMKLTKENTSRRWLKCVFDWREIMKDASLRLMLSNIFVFMVEQVTFSDLELYEERCFLEKHGF